MTRNLSAGARAAQHSISAGARRGGAEHEGAEHAGAERDSAGDDGGGHGSAGSERADRASAAGDPTRCDRADRDGTDRDGTDRDGADRDGVERDRSGGRNPVRAPVLRVLPGTAESPGAARRLARQLLGDADPSAETVMLLVSELVTNAIVHSQSGSPGGTVTVALCPGRRACWSRFAMTAAQLSRAWPPRRKRRSTATACCWSTRWLIAGERCRVPTAASPGAGSVPGRRLLTHWRGVVSVSF